MNVLKKLEETCEGIAQFWTSEADAFDSQGAGMKEIKIRSMRSGTVKKNVSFWREAKEEIDSYAKVISIVDQHFQVDASVKQGSVKYLTFPENDLSLEVPTTVDTKFLQ